MTPPDARALADALARIATAAEAIERAEEPPREAAQDIQRMARAALLRAAPAGGWPWQPCGAWSALVERAFSDQDGTERA